MMPKLLILLAIVCISAGLVAIDYLGGPKAIEIKPAPNKEAVQDFEFVTINGKTHRLHDFQGKRVLINIWATWCPPCIVELPLLFDYAQAHQKDFVLIAISVDRPDVDLNAFLKKLGEGTDKQVKLKNIHIARDNTYAISRGIFNVTKYPESFLLHPDLTVQQKFLGVEAVQAWIASQHNGEEGESAVAAPPKMR